jgi:hypothetical protein
MARPKADRTGKAVSLYLSPERLDLLAMVAEGPAAALYALIDRLKPVPTPEPDLSPLDAPAAPTVRSSGLCARCLRTGWNPHCPNKCKPAV